MALSKENLVAENTEIFMYAVVPLFKVFPEFRVFHSVPKNRMFWKLYRKLNCSYFKRKMFCVGWVGVFSGQ